MRGRGCTLVGTVGRRHRDARHAHAMPIGRGGESIQHAAWIILIVDRIVAVQYELDELRVTTCVL